jgi:hypothetical protein
MHASQRYRYNAAECRLAAQNACQPYYRKLHLSLAASWLLLASQDEAMQCLCGAVACQIVLPICN